MPEFRCDYIKPKHQEKAILSYMDTDSFIVNIKTEGAYAGTPNDVEKRYDKSNYETDRPLLISKNKNVVGVMKDELGRKIMTEYVELGPTVFLFNR